MNINLYTHIGSIGVVLLHIYLVAFHVKKDSATNASARLAHLQAPTYRLMLQLAKEPNFYQHTDK